MTNTNMLVKFDVAVKFCLATSADVFLSSFLDQTSFFLLFQ